MISKEYSEAAVEVLDILKHVDSENVKKDTSRVYSIFRRKQIS